MFKQYAQSTTDNEALTRASDDAYKIANPPAGVGYVVELFEDADYDYRHEVTLPDQGTNEYGALFVADDAGLEHWDEIGASYQVLDSFG